MLIAFDGITRPIALEGCEDLRGCLTSVLRGWRFEEVASTGTGPVITIRKRNEKYRLQTPSLGPPLDQASEVGAVCAFVADLVQVYIAEQSSLLCLHCGAAAFAGRLAIFPNSYRAGKSTLLARLAAAGIPIFADDVLPVAHASGDAIALGVAPRLRLPLPSNASGSFRRFVQAHRGPSDDRYLYLDLPTAVLPRHGSRMPVAACVLLDRRCSGTAQLVPTVKSLGLQRLILQNFARAVPVNKIAGCLRSLVSRVPCFTLRYCDLEDAAGLLLDAFYSRLLTDPSKSDAFAGAHAYRYADMSVNLRPQRARRRLPSALRYRRNPAIRVHIVDGDGFLVDPRTQSIFHLNAVAAGLWRLLREPTTAAEVAKILHGAFPEVDHRELKRDVQALLAALLTREMILPQQPGEAQ